MIKAIRLVRFKGFEDSGWIHLRKVTLLFGLNSSGKSSILNALLMLKQSLENPANEVPFTFHSEKGIDIGTYEEVVHNHVIDEEQPIELQLKLDIPRQVLEPGIVVPFDFEDITCSISIGYNQKRETVMMQSYSMTDNKNRTILRVDYEINNPKVEKISSEIFPDVSKLRIRNRSNFLRLLDPRATETMDLGSYEAIETLKFISLTTLVLATVAGLLENIAHVGPLRTEVNRAYLFTGENPDEVGRRGEEALKLLYLDRLTETQELTRSVNQWLAKYNYQFVWKTFGGFFQLILRDTRSNLEVNVKDVGFGISQILPVIIQGYLPNEQQTVLIEQPEIHLHAGAQAELGDLFIDMANQTGKRFLVETHSEHLLLRLRRRIAQTTLSAENGDEAPFPLRPEDVAIHFVESTSKGSIVHLLNVEDTGQLTNIPDAFRSFFADDFEETMKITETIAKLKQARQNLKE